MFIPTAFIPGITGRLYQQFAVTIAVSVIISAFNALTLSPALSALLLRPKKEARGPLGKFFGWFNRMFNAATNDYVKVCRMFIHKMAFAIILLVAFGVLAGFIGGKLPTSFLPDEDQGYVFIAQQLPEAASLQRTSAAASNVEDLLKKTPGVAHVTTVVGYSMLSGVATTYNTFFWVTFDPWGERKAKDEQYINLIIHLNDVLGKLPEGTTVAFPPPAIPGVGASGGVTYILEDRGGHDVEFLANNTNRFLEAAQKRPEIARIFTTFLPSVPQVYVNVDRHGRPGRGGSSELRARITRRLKPSGSRSISVAKSCFNRSAKSCTICSRLSDSRTITQLPKPGRNLGAKLISSDNHSERFGEQGQQIQRDLAEACGSRNRGMTSQVPHCQRRCFRSKRIWCQVVPRHLGQHASLWFQPKIQYYCRYYLHGM